jgi:Tol biopolymer transport system component
MSGGDGEHATVLARMKLPALPAVAALAILASLVILTPLVAHAAVGDVTLVSRGATGAPPANGDSGPGLAVSPNGRFIAFESKAANLSDAAQSGVTNIFLSDRKTGTTTLVSRADGADGAGADGDSASPSMSPAGRFIAFESVADNLSSDDDNAVRNVFVRDTYTNTTTLVSRPGDGTAANGNSSHPAVSVNGTGIAFDSTADNLSDVDNDAFSNVYVRNMDTGAITVASTPLVGASIPADGDSYAPTIDRDGKRVAYTSTANNLYNKDNDAVTNVFVTDLQTRFTTAVSMATGGFLQQTPSDGESFGGAISADGRYVAFISYAENFVDAPLRTPQIADVFRRDIQASKTELVSRATGVDGAPALANSSHPSISGDGRSIAFESAAANLSADDTAGPSIFTRFLDDHIPNLSATTLVSRATGLAGAAANGSSYAPVLSRDGTFVAFSSDAANLSDADNDAVRDVFARQVPVTPPAPDIGPDLGTNDHSGHDPSSPDHGVHSATDHAAAGHAGHVTATGGPEMSFFGPPIQRIRALFMLVQVHDAAKLLVNASVKLGGKASSVYRFKRFLRSVPAHKVNRIRFKLAKSKLRAVSRALKRGKRLTVKVVASAQSAPGGKWTTLTRSVKLRK